MCTVQVLITADVMRNLRRNVMVRRPNRESICRKLFFEQDEAASELQVTSQAALKLLQTESNAQSALRWNFDFLQGRPLPGRYQWVPVSATAVPSVARTERPVADEVRTERPVVNEVRTEEPVVDEIRTKPEESKIESTNCKQSKITDFLHSRKRTRRNSTSVESPKAKKMRLTHKTNCNTSVDSTSSPVTST